MRTIKGFTLIELMIVVAIIGILAAIAIPTYHTFVAKSQVLEAIVLLDAARTNSEDNISITGEFPLDKPALISINTKTNGSFGQITGSANTTTNSPTGDVVFIFNNNNVNDIIKNKSIWYTRNINGEWLCKSNINNRSILPHTCIFEANAPLGS
ncbi:MAG: pilin [Candidatus Thiothrix putei]|uniref:Type IV pilus assembly protein PilA n=2 Tax=Thiothrix TaxID=1030 RepID=A0A1H4BGV0_9GAMM|nr:pilin [Thiothrix caldifontis]WGZ95329.1 MAG: pilin [Candidatus Thiothrix putei]SEA47350.1 type IV pilus assembly protein PilA [Thiothrix caldifontis]